MSKVLHTTAADDNDKPKAIATPWVFSENCQAKNIHCLILKHFLNLKETGCFVLKFRTFFKE